MASREAQSGTRAMTPETRLKVTQVKSAIGTKPKQRATLRTLGLGGRGDTAIQPDRPEIRGMVATVSHLLALEEIERAGSVE